MITSTSIIVISIAIRINRLANIPIEIVTIGTSYQARINLLASTIDKVISNTARIYRTRDAISKVQDFSIIARDALTIYWTICLTIFIHLDTFLIFWKVVSLIASTTDTSNYTDTIRIWSLWDIIDALPIWEIGACNTCDTISSVIVICITIRINRLTFLIGIKIVAIWTENRIRNNLYANSIRI